MTADATLRVDPALLQGCAASLGGAAEDLASELAELDDRVGQTLGGWRGASGTAYGSAWQLWHQGAREVQVGLSMLARLMGHAGAVYQDNEAVATRAERAVHGG
jgi:WXG100 family type VII secretion target